MALRRQRPGTPLQDPTGRNPLLRAFAPLGAHLVAVRRLALAIDLTLKGDQTTAIVISVLYRSCAIPVAWRIHHATQRGSWTDPTVKLLRELAPAVPHDMTVISALRPGHRQPQAVEADTRVSGGGKLSRAGG